MLREEKSAEAVSPMQSDALFIVNSTSPPLLPSQKYSIRYREKSIYRAYIMRITHEHLRRGAEVFVQKGL